MNIMNKVFLLLLIPCIAFGAQKTIRTDNLMFGYAEDKGFDKCDSNFNEVYAFDFDYIMGNGASTDQPMTLQSPSASSTPLTIEAYTGQTANIINVTDSDDNNIFHVKGNGRVFTNTGYQAYALKWGGSLMLWDSNGIVVEHDITNNSGNFDLIGGNQENLFSDSTNAPFSQNDADINNWIIIRSGDRIGAMAQIDEFVTSSEIVLDTIAWDDDLTNINYRIIKQPMVVIGDNSHSEFQVGSEGHFDIHANSWTGNLHTNYVFKIKMDAGKDGVDEALFESNANGYSNVNSIVVDYISGDLGPGESGGAIGARINVSNATSADATTEVTNYISAISNGSDATTRGLYVLPGHKEAVTVAGSEFEVIEYADNTASSKDVDETYEYSTGNNTWSALTLLSNGVDGYKSGGQVSFSAPADWATGSEAEAPGDITSGKYVKITRTYGPVIPISPIEDHYKIYESKDLGMKIRGDGTVQFTTMADIDAPDDSTYYSSDQSKLVYKDKGGTVRDLY